MCIVLFKNEFLCLYYFLKICIRIISIGFAEKYVVLAFNEFTEFINRVKLLCCN